jgi:purine nucleosidase
MPQKIIIDTDPGQDDAVAILLALASPEEIEVLGVTTVAGNVPLPRTALNARKILALAGRSDIGVYAGCARPLTRELVTAEHVHGPTGLDGPSFPDPTVPLREQHAVDFIIETILQEEAGTITLCVLGPMTNVAMGLVKAPEIAMRIRQIVSMGGAYFEVGNITPAAEFNILVDPEAADIVLRSGIPITMLPLDVTHQVLATKPRFERIRAIGNKAGQAVVDMLTFSEKFDLNKYGWDGAPLHDPCVIAYLLKPELFRGRTINVTVETMSPLTKGMTVVDWWQITDRPRNALFIKDADADGIYDLLTHRIARLD